MAAAAELADALRANPLLAYNNPALSDKIHSKQPPFHAATTRVKVYTGGTRAGKSSAGVVDDLIQLLPREYVPPHLLPYKRKDPPFKCRIITPDLGVTMRGIQEVLRNWCPPGALDGGSWGEAYKGDKRILTFACGSMVDFMSYEADLDKFGSVALDRVHLDEEPPGEKGQAIYTQSLRRLVDYQGDLLLTATPEFGLSWTSTELWDERGEEVEDRVWANEWLTIVRASTHDNPFVPADALSESRMTEEEYKVKVLGEWFHLQGLVYGEFSEKDHVVTPPDPKHVSQLETLVGIDPGIRTTAVVFCGFDKDNSMLLYDELYLHDGAAIPEEVAKHVRSRLGKWGVKGARFVIDPSARNRNLVTGENTASAFARAGLSVEPGQNEVEAGVFEVKRRLQNKPTPSLLISDTCRGFLKEIGRYRMDDKSDGSFGVIKKDDHGLDAARYVAMARNWNRAAPAKKKRPIGFGEPDYIEPPYKPSLPLDQSPLGTFT